MQTHKQTNEAKPGSASAPSAPRIAGGNSHWCACVRARVCARVCVRARVFVRVRAIAMRACVSVVCARVCVCVLLLRWQLLPLDRRAALKQTNTHDANCARTRNYSAGAVSRRAVDRQSAPLRGNASGVGVVDEIAEVRVERLGVLESEQQLEHVAQPRLNVIQPVTHATAAPHPCNGRASSASRAIASTRCPLQRQGLSAAAAAAAHVRLGVAVEKAAARVEQRARELDVALCHAADAFSRKLISAQAYRAAMRHSRQR